MSDYVVRFKSSIVPYMKPAEWPDQIVNEVYIRAKDFQELRDLVNKYLLVFSKQGGTSFMKDTKKPHSEDIETLDLRVFVPFHMITHIETETKRMVADMPGEGDEGIFLQ